MKLLLDTHLLLWAAGDSKRLSAVARALIEEPGNALFFSAASLWEISIKRGLGRSDFQVDPRVLRRGLLDNGYNELQVNSEHAVALAASCIRLAVASLLAASAALRIRSASCPVHHFPTVAPALPVLPCTGIAIAGGSMLGRHGIAHQVNLAVDAVLAQQGMKQPDLHEQFNSKGWHRSGRCRIRPDGLRVGVPGDDTVAA